VPVGVPETPWDWSFSTVPPENSVQPMAESFLQTNGQPCFNLAKRIPRCAPVREHFRTSNFKISNGKDEQHAARVDSRLFQAARRS
jgi:hypothetical protein